MGTHGVIWARLDEARQMVYHFFIGYHRGSEPVSNRTHEQTLAYVITAMVGYGAKTFDILPGTLNHE